jgi:uncharacterized protein
LVILALARDRWSTFGIVRPKWVADIILGCVICFFCAIFRKLDISLLPLSILRMLHASRAAHQLNLGGVSEYALLFIACAVNASAQELIYRGYLIPRFERLLRSTWLAVLVTSVLFGSFHLYQGVASAILTTGSGLVYAIAFCMFRRLWPLCVSHALHNILVMLWITR